MGFAVSMLKVGDRIMREMEYRLKNFDGIGRKVLNMFNNFTIFIIGYGMIVGFYDN